MILTPMSSGVNCKYRYMYIQCICNLMTKLHARRVARVIKRSITRARSYIFNEMIHYGEFASKHSITRYIFER